jgi:hypothetical protein
MTCFSQPLMLHRSSARGVYGGCTDGTAVTLPFSEAL